VSDAFPELPLSRACGGQRPQAAQRKPSVLSDAGPAAGKGEVPGLEFTCMGRQPWERTFVAHRAPYSRFSVKMSRIAKSRAV